MRRLDSSAPSVGRGSKLVPMSTSSKTKPAKPPGRRDSADPSPGDASLAKSPDEELEDVRGEEDKVE